MGLAHCLKHVAHRFPSSHQTLPASQAQHQSRGENTPARHQPVRPWPACAPSQRDRPHAKTDHQSIRAVFQHLLRVVHRYPKITFRIAKSAWRGGRIIVAALISACAFSSSNDPSDGVKPPKRVPNTIPHGPRHHARLQWHLLPNHSRFQQALCLTFALEKLDKTSRSRAHRYFRR